MSSTASYELFQGDWPILDTASLPSSLIMNTISKGATGNGLSQYLPHFSLGLFYIDANLVEPHPCQRPIMSSHVNSLVNEFEGNGVNREENYGTVIGLGNGWTQMKNKTPFNYRISSNCIHLDKLSLTTNGPIGQVIRGGHRTEAIKSYSQKDGQESEGYWLYNVLLPCKLFIII